MLNQENFEKAKNGLNTALAGDRKQYGDWRNYNEAHTRCLGLVSLAEMRPLMPETDIPDVNPIKFMWDWFADNVAKAA